MLAQRKEPHTWTTLRGGWRRSRPLTQWIFRDGRRECPGPAASLGGGRSRQDRRLCACCGWVFLVGTRAARLAVIPLLAATRMSAGRSGDRLRSPARGAPLRWQGSRLQLASACASIGPGLLRPRRPRAARGHPLCPAWASSSLVALSSGGRPLKRRLSPAPRQLATAIACVSPWRRRRHGWALRVALVARGPRGVGSGIPRRYSEQVIWPPVSCHRGRWGAASNLAGGGRGGRPWADQRPGPPRMHIRPRTEASADDMAYTKTLIGQRYTSCRGEGERSL